MLETVFLKLLDMTAAGSLVILALLPVRLLLKKAPKAFSYALWAVVLLRLLCPFTLKAPLSLMPAIEPVAESYALSQEPISPTDAGLAAWQLAGDILNGGIGSQHVRTDQTDAWGNREYVITDWWNVLLLSGQYLWLAGLAAMLLAGAFSWLRLRLRLREAMQESPGIWLAENIPTPFVLGLLKPRIYLPMGLTLQEREFILLHEWQHIRRGDPLLKLLAYCALCLHWFNPLVWLAFHLSCKDMEMSCDEAVLKKMGGQIRADYAAALLTLATDRRHLGITPLAFGEGDPKGRIRNLSRWKKPALWILITAGLSCAVLALCLLTDPPPKKPLTLVPNTVSSDGLYLEITGKEEDQLLITWHNNTDTDVMYGASFVIEYLEQDKWVRCKSATQNISFPAVAYLLPAGESRQERYSLTAPYLANAPAPYRFLSDCWPANGGDTLTLIAEYALLVEESKEESGNPTGPTSTTPSRLTLQKVLELSQLGEKLTWEALLPYEFQSVGSGLYVCDFPIDPGYNLRVTKGRQQGTPWSVLLVTTATGASVDIRTGDVKAFLENHKANYLDTLIEAAIAAQQSSSSPDGLLHVSSHKILAEETALDPAYNRDICHTAYLLVTEKSYSMYEGLPTEVGGSSGVAAITFTVDEAGQYTLAEYWTPRDGSNYVSDIRAKFPGDASENALNCSEAAKELDRSCYEKACAYLAGTDSLRDRIDELFWVVSSSPAQHSAPGPYIEAHREQWQELLGYGAWTLRYCFEEFTPSNQKGLRELLMALACEEILISWNEKDFPPVEGHGTGSEWFNHFKEYAFLLSQNISGDDIEKYHPGAFLLLENLSPSLIFTDLPAGQEQVGTELIRIRQDGGELYYHAAYSSATCILEFGLLGEDGTRISQEFRHGYSFGTLRDIPAGTWLLYIKNIGHISGLMPDNATGLVNCTVHEQS